MLYLLLRSASIYKIILTMTAVLPGLFIMRKIYKKDTLEKEDPKLLRQLIAAGVASAVIALVEELVVTFLASPIAKSFPSLYMLIENYLIIALAEESSKYIMLKKSTWKSPEFNCLYDGILYACYISLGFAIYENIKYVFSIGLSAAIIRAFTAVPAHTSFGVFMGIYYAEAKRNEYLNNVQKMKRCKIMSLLIPVLLHGTYDYVARLGTLFSVVAFLVFIIAMFIATSVIINKHAKNDLYIGLFDLRDKD